MKIALGGSRKLPKGFATRILVQFLARLEPDTVVLLRRGISTDPGNFEADVAELCEYLKLEVDWREPVINEKHYGRGSVFIRDMDMAHDADLMVCFIDGDAYGPNDLYSGTAHLLDKAIEANKPVYGYIVDEKGFVSRWGENDPDEQWVDLLPPPT